MKPLLVSLLTTVLFSFKIEAQNNDRSDDKQGESAYMSVKSNDEIITYQFHSIKDLEESSDKILDEMESDKEAGKSTSIITIEVSVSEFVGLSSTTIKGSVTTTSENASTVVKKLRSQLIAAITS